MAVVGKQPVERRDAPRVSTVFLTDEGLRHARCRTVLAFIRRRQGLELDFHCRACHEHISLTEYALTRIPFGAPISAPRGSDEFLSADSSDD